MNFFQSSSITHCPTMHSARFTHRIGRPFLYRRGRMLVYESQIEIAGQKPAKLRFKCSPSFRSWISSSAAPFLVATLVPAMLVGGDIIVDGYIPEALVWRINTTIQDYLLRALPRLKRVHVVSRPMSRVLQAWIDCTKCLRPSARILGFSGGVDAFFSLYNLHLESSCARPGLTHLAFHDCGSHGHRSKAAKRLRRARFKSVKALGKEISLPVIEVRSNMDDFYKGISFEETFPLRNIASSLLFARSKAQFFYSAAHGYKRLHEGDAVSLVEPFLYPLFSLKSLTFSLEGCEVLRPEKLVLLARVPLTHRFLNVCIAPANSPQGFPNCGVCRKCFHTLVVLDACDSIGKYADIFDLQAYYEIRDQSIPGLQTSDSLLARTAYVFLREAGFLDQLNSGSTHSA